MSLLGIPCVRNRGMQNLGIDHHLYDPARRNISGCAAVLILVSGAVSTRQAGEEDERVDGFSLMNPPQWFPIK